MPSALETLAISIAGGTATGITGMLLIHLRERWSENRQITRDALAEAEETLDKCRRLSEIVWTHTGGELLNEAQEVVSLLHDLNQILNFVKEDGYPVQLYVMSALINFRRATSGDEFDVKGRTARQDRVLTIRQNSILLKLALRRLIRVQNKKWL